MRLIRRLAFCVFLLSPAITLAAPPESWKKPAIQMLDFFETSSNGYGKVTPDFDCQGLSGGVLQWNVGKGSLWTDLLSKLPLKNFTTHMPTYGADFRASLSQPRPQRLAYVRQFQKFANSSSCDGNVRRATWNRNGVAFAQEVSSLLKSPEAIALQQKALGRKLKKGWEYAQWWANAKRGPKAEPTYLEFATFTDTLNFNGRWTEMANYQKVKTFKANRSTQEVLNEIPTYLAAAPSGQYQRKEARENAKLWRSAKLTEEQIDLLSFAYLIAKNITKESALPFKLNTISRRGTIILGDGWVNGKRIQFPTP